MNIQSNIDKPNENEDQLQKWEKKFEKKLEYRDNKLEEKLEKRD